jgi:hypothetical protein
MRGVQKMSNTVSKRLIVIALVYTLLVLASIYSFEWLRHSVELGLISKPTYSLLGPSLALFTHMSILLFIPLTAIVFGALLLWVFKPKLKWISLIFFIILWLATGWWMYDLF